MFFIWNTIGSGINKYISKLIALALQVYFLKKIIYQLFFLLS